MRRKPDLTAHSGRSPLDEMEPSKSILTDGYGAGTHQAAEALQGWRPYAKAAQPLEPVDLGLQSAWNRVRGVEPLSFCDWPGHTAMVFFCGGCNLRCPTCHNAEMAWQHERLPAVPRAKALSMLAERKRWLDGIVVTGGEPSIVPQIGTLLEDLGRVGLPVKMDSNGMRPDILQALLEQKLADQFFVDVKGPFRLYPHLTGQAVSESKARASMEQVFDLARKHPGRFVFRITRVPLLTDKDIEEVRSCLPQEHTLKIQHYQEPRRTYAQADSETGRVRGNMVAGTDCTGDTQGVERLRHQGPDPVQASGAEGRDQAA